MRFVRLKTLSCGFLILALSLTSGACGLRGDAESVSDETGSTPGSGEETGEAPEEEAMEGQTAVADFYYMTLSDVITDGHAQYAITDEFLYYTDIINGGEEGAVPKTHVVRQSISDGHREENFIVSAKTRAEIRDRLLLADKNGCCYVFWTSGATEEEADSGYSMEKYGAGGELLWHVDYTEENFQGMAESLDQGIVTQDGRVFLYTYGEGGCIFAFNEEGEMEKNYTPALESLEGVAVGKDGRAYGYCITMGEPMFLEIGGTGEGSVCPIVPLQVYSGYDAGILLRDREGMWQYEPDTGETEKLWGWEDEYVQINGDHVDRVFAGDRGYTLLCLEQEDFDPIHTRQVLTLAKVVSADRRDYPGKQAVTLLTVFKDSWLDKMVKMYNRHSKKYKVEIAEERNRTSLEKRLIQGEDVDLVNLADFYAESLAEHGAFEELGSYYEASGTVDREDILEPVLEACTVRGKEVGVIPAFSIGTLQGKELWCAPEEWDVWKFLEMSRENRMLGNQEPTDIFNFCMGIRYGEHFIDWENRECHFDNEEFRQILEACGSIRSYKDPHHTVYFLMEAWEGDWLFQEQSVASLWDVVSEPTPFSEGDPEYAAKMPGYPGWEGGEYRLEDYGVFAISSASGHKEGAWEFLEYLLSGEYQDTVDWAFPVRKSSFEFSLENLYNNSFAVNSDGESGPAEADIASLRNMVDSVVYDNWRGKNNLVRGIVEEEAGMYFAGDATLDATVSKIQKRVQTYLDEQ